MKTSGSMVLAICIASACSAANSQHLFKCGATFQDKPCDTEIQKKYSPLTGSFSKEQVNAAADTQCADLGVRAMPIIQARTNKETLEGLHSQIDAKPIGRLEKIKQKELVSSVFAKKGTPAETRGAVEAECMDSKQTSKARYAISTPSVYPDSSRFTDADARAEVFAARKAAAAARASRRY
jgi:hypothetical protein